MNPSEVYFIAAVIELYRRKSEMPSDLYDIGIPRGTINNIIGWNVGDPIALRHLDSSARLDNPRYEDLLNVLLNDCLPGDTLTWFAANELAAVGSHDH